MPLPFFKRSKTEAVAPDAGPASPGDEAGTVQAARTRARRRLIGAVVLLAAGVIGFPVLFETQPRPWPADIPIQVATSSPGGVAPTVAAPAPVRPASKPLPPLPAPPADAGTESPAAASGPSTGAEALAAVASSPVTTPATAASRPPAQEQPRTVAKAESPKPASAPTSKAPAEAASARPAVGDAARVAALADKPKPAASAAAAKVEAAASAPKAGRYVVQVGAFTDPAALRDARQRVEKLGFKSYTQVVETAAGARTRVRVGPFDTREEAERAGKRLKSGGLPANLLTL